MNISKWDRVGARMVALGAGLWLGMGVCVGAGFVGPYATNHWTLTNTNADGFLDFSNAPAKVRMVGGDNASYGQGLTEWVVTVPAPALLSFDWKYSTRDDNSGPFDRGGWRLNGTYHELATDSTTNTHWTGHVDALVGTGDAFSFWVKTEDNLGYPAELTIGPFSATNSPPRFICTTVAQQNVKLQFESIVGKTYRLEASALMPSLNWKPVISNIVAISNITELNTSVTSPTQQFFRLVQQP